MKHTAIVLCCLVLILTLRSAGIFLAFIGTALYYGSVPENFDKRLASTRILTIGQLVVPYVVLLLSLPFCNSLMASGTVPFLANLPVLKLPIDKIILSLSIEPERYSELLSQAKSARGLRHFFLEIYPAIFLSVFSALVWFSVALPTVVKARYSNEPQLAHNKQKLTASILVILSVITLVLNSDLIFLSGWTGRSSLTTITIPQSMLFILLNLFEGWNKKSD